jgi:hypothetical protein
MSGGAISTISTSFGAMFSRASIFLQKQKPTAKRLGTAMRFRASA